MNKKTKITIITIMVILVLIIISGIITWYIVKWDKEKTLNTPEEISNTYFEYINEGKYEKAYELLTTESKNTISKEDFIKAYTYFYDEIGCEAIKTNKINEEKIDTYNVKVSYSNSIRSIYGDIKFANTLNLKKQEDKKFYIDWTYNTIYPNFELGDSINKKEDLAKRGNIIDRNGILLARNRLYCINWCSSWVDE